MSALRITAATIARTMLAALPEGQRIKVACEALQTVSNPDRDVDLRAVATVVADHAAVLSCAALRRIHTRFPPVQGGLK